MVTVYSRYYGQQTLKFDGKIFNVQRTVVSSDADADAASVVHTLIGEETLDQLAAQYYGREDLWWRIADANQGKFPLDWQAGDTLIIPPIGSATRTPR